MAVRTRSPFPGMDPYLERHWGDVHSRMIGYIADELQQSLPPDLAARMTEWVTVATEEGERRGHHREPDVLVTVRDYGSGGGVAVLDAPPDTTALLLEPHLGPTRQRTLHILDADGHRVVTAIEMISPSNKRGAGLQQYLARQDTYRSSGTHLVEIDLIAGDWRPMLPGFKVPDGHHTTYRYTVWPAIPHHRPVHYPIALQNPLPPLNIPLRETDTPVTLHLQPILEKAYEMGRYGTLRYDAPPSAELSDADVTWLREQWQTAAANSTTA